MVNMLCWSPLPPTLEFFFNYKRTRTNCSPGSCRSQLSFPSNWRQGLWENKWCWSYLLTSLYQQLSTEDLCLIVWLKLFHITERSWGHSLDHPPQRKEDFQLLSVPGLVVGAKCLCHPGVSVKDGPSRFIQKWRRWVWRRARYLELGECCINEYRLL